MIKNHRIQGVRLIPTPNWGRYIIPRVIVLHDTAGRLDYRTSVDWLTNPRSRASAHLVVGRKGEVVQLAEFNKRTWHAGKSIWNGRKNVNNFGIGIEIANPGRLDMDGKAWFDQRFNPTILKEYMTPFHPHGLWMPYTEEQISRVEELCTILMGHYDTIEDITTHWEISPGRKHDTNPLFPLEELRAKLLKKGEK